MNLIGTVPSYKWEIRILPNNHIPYLIEQSTEHIFITNLLVYSLKIYRVKCLKLVYIVKQS